MRHTPLQFLRHDLKKTKRKKAMRLPKWSFLSRFRLRIMFQNVTNYLILFVGILFISIMLAMAVGMPETLDYYKSNVSDMMFTNYQYVLKSYENEDGDIITTNNKDAEKFNMTSLQHKSDTLDEEISVYGIEDDSRYVKISDLSALKGNEAYISASYADKYSLSVGDTVVLDENMRTNSMSLRLQESMITVRRWQYFCPMSSIVKSLTWTVMHSQAISRIQRSQILMRMRSQPSSQNTTLRKCVTSSIIPWALI